MSALAWFIVGYSAGAFTVLVLLAAAQRRVEQAPDVPDLPPRVRQRAQAAYHARWN